MNTVVLDTTPVSLLCHPRMPPDAIACRQWLANLKAAGRRVVVPEISDCEHRRECQHRNLRRSLRTLDVLVHRVEFVPISTPIMIRAAELWALARPMGRPTAGPNALDADVILVAEAESLGVPFIFATSNANHLRPMAPADDWFNIPA